MVDNANLVENNDLENDNVHHNEIGNNNTQEDELEVLFDGTDENNQDSDSIGFASVLFLTVNATLGAGMLTIPYAFQKNGGLVNSSLFQFVSLSLSLFTVSSIRQLTPLFTVSHVNCNPLVDNAQSWCRDLKD